MPIRTGLLAAAFILSGLLIDATDALADDHRDDAQETVAPCPYAKESRMGPEKIFEAMDKDGDGAISADEFVAFHEQMLREKFARIDDDGDGTVSKTELKLHHERMKNRMRMMGGTKGAPGKPAGMMHGMPHHDDDQPGKRRKDRKDDD